MIIFFLRTVYIILIVDLFDQFVRQFYYQGQDRPTNPQHPVPECLVAKKNK